ncbi:MAG TPA: SpoIIE family protein phosphatase [Thermoanaerobaculia bacterium]|nr:SpoIIE family protein phosphatase [Thermoanaerobaculia bacterium]
MSLRKSTRVWLILTAVAVAMVAAGDRIGQDSPFTPLGILLLCVAGVVLLVRVARLLARKLFYRLSWRLAFSYFLIGVLPIPMVALLITIAADMTVGQFEVFRVDGGIRELGSRMLAGQIPGVRKAEIRDGVVATSDIAALPAGERAPSWVRLLGEPRFVGASRAEFLAVAVLSESGAAVSAVPVDDLFYARLAELSGVALLPLSRNASARSRGGAIHIEVDPADRSRRVGLQTARADEFIYPPQAIPQDHSSHPLKVVSWVYTSRPILGSAGEGAEARTLAAFTRLSWSRAFGELFEQGAIEQKNSRWPIIALMALGGLLLAVYLVALLTAYLLIRTITKTVNRLTKATGHIAAGDFSVRIATKAHDQVGDLARSFDLMAGSLESTLQDRAARELLDREIDQARLIAQKLLPAPGAAVPGLDADTYFEPVARMGGDYYDFLATRDGKTAVAIGDVSGHGLPTALLVATAKAALATLLESGESGAALFSKMNALLFRSTDTRNYMTLALAVLVGPGEISLTNAGHPPPYRISGSRVEPLELPAFPLGIFAAREFPTRTFAFAPGDRLVFYTDGIIECRDAADDAFGFERFEKILASHAADPLPALRQAILDGVREHCSSAVADDDRTLVLCERSASPD